MEDDLPLKMTFDGIRPSMEDALSWKTTFHGRLLPSSMEDKLGWKKSFNERKLSMEERGFETTLCNKL